jgi:hypothetical protein
MLSRNMSHYERWEIPSLQMVWGWISGKDMLNFTILLFYYLQSFRYPHLSMSPDLSHGLKKSCCDYTTKVVGDWLTAICMYIVEPTSMYIILLYIVTEADRATPSPTHISTSSHFVPLTAAPSSDTNSGSHVIDDKHITYSRPDLDILCHVCDYIYVTQCLLLLLISISYMVYIITPMYAFVYINRISLREYLLFIRISFIVIMILLLMLKLWLISIHASNGIAYSNLSLLLLSYDLHNLFIAGLYCLSTSSSYLLIAILHHWEQ